MKTLTFIAATGSPDRRPRLEKAIRIAKASALPLAYWGWRRAPDEPMGAGLFDGERRVLASGPAGGMRTVIGYLRLGLGVFFAALANRGPRVYWALGLETALWLRIVALFRKVDYVFDDADRFVLTVPLPAWLRPAVARLERSVSRHALAHVVPLKARYDYDSGTFYVIENLPDDGLVRRSREISIEPPQARLLVYVSGWVGPNRGSAMIERAARRLEGENITFVLATRTFDSAAKSLLLLPNVHELGYVSQDESLAWCRACNVSLTFYDPALPINRLAAPNKWGDALVCERPFIVNVEVATAAPYVQAGAAFAVPWDDDEALVQLLLSLRDDDARRECAGRAMASLHAQTPQYEDRIVTLLRRIRGLDSSHAANPVA
ncbi:MAG: hypothetical protein WBA36_08410 [Mesorhizobium sp.]